MRATRTVKVDSAVAQTLGSEAQSVIDCINSIGAA
jgi:hypothetical protein